MGSEMVAVVTGANKGIGFAIVRGLLRNQKHPTKVILCSRDEERGVEAVNNIKTEFKEKSNLISFEQLDLGDTTSISNFSKTLFEKYGRLDILIHNAAIAFKDSDPTPFKQQAEPTMKINYFSTLQLNQQLLPLLRESSDPRVIFISSTAGAYAFANCNDKIKKKFKETVDIDSIVHEFISLCKTGGEDALKKNGFAATCYETSKLSLTAKVKRLSEEPENKDVFMASMCPGYVKTDMSSGRGTKTPEEGADTALYLALMSKEERVKLKVKSGAFWSERAVASYL